MARPTKRNLEILAAEKILAADAGGGLLRLTPEERAAMETVAHNSPAVKMARLAGSGRISRVEVERLFNQTRLMGRGVSKLILEMLLEKATYGDACAYDADTLKFLAKGFGIVSPSKPVDDADRERQAASAARIKAMTDDELADDILATVRSTQEAGRISEDEEKRLRRNQ